MINGNHKPNANGHFETTDLNLAAFLYAKDVEFIGLRWKDNSTQAIFVFETPTAEVLASWLLDEGKFIKRYEDGRNLLRDKVRGK